MQQKDVSRAHRARAGPTRVSPARRVRAPAYFFAGFFLSCLGFLTSFFCVLFPLAMTESLSSVSAAPQSRPRGRAFTQRFAATVAADRRECYAGGGK
jgi:hypothetical protein